MLEVCGGVEIWGNACLLEQQTKQTKKAEVGTGGLNPVRTINNAFLEFPPRLEGMSRQPLQLHLPVNSQ